MAGHTDFTDLKHQVNKPDGPALLSEISRA